MQQFLFSLLLSMCLLGYSQNTPINFQLEVSGYSNPYLDNIQNNFSQRTDSVFSRILTNPYPPYPAQFQTSSDLVLYVWNKENQAIAALMKNQMVSIANAELRDALDSLMSHPDWLVADNGFHWRSEIPGRLWEMFRADTTRLETATKLKIEEIFLAWSQDMLVPELSDTSRLWAYWGSENHHVMRVYTAWQGTKILSGGPHKTTQINGFTIEQHFERLNLYVQLYLKERTLKGGLIEHGSYTYAKYVLQCIYNYYDFAEPETKKYAKAFLDSWWADFGQENMDFVRGGAKNRVAQTSVENTNQDGTYKMIWAYTGGGFPLVTHPAYACLHSSSYRLPSIVLDMILDNRSLGSYTILNSKAAKKSTIPSPDPEWHFMDSTSDTVAHRLTYVSKNFVMGTHILPYLHRNKWVEISSQNRWNNVIFSAAPNSRLFPLVSPNPNKIAKVYNAEYAFQYQGTMISRKIHNAYSRNTGTEMRVFFSDDLTVEEQAPGAKDDWLFVQASGAYAAVKGLHGTYSWDDDNYIRFAVDTTPVIIEVVEQANFDSYDDFKQAILNRNIKDSASVLSFNSISDGTLIDFSYQRGGGLMAINGTVLNIYQKLNFFSKYMAGIWGDENLQINKSGRLLKPVISGAVEPWIKPDFIQIYQDIQLGEIAFTFTNAAMYDFYAEVLDPTLVDTNSIAFTYLGGDMMRLSLSSQAGKTGLTELNIFAEEKTTGIEDEALKQLVIYPNPFDQVLNLSTLKELKAGANITLIDNMGRVVFDKTLFAPNNHLRLSLAELPAGLYFLRVKSTQGEDELIRKLIKN